MNETTIREFIVSFFYVPEPEAFSDDQSLLDSGIVDSIGMFDVIAFLEKQFGFKIKDEEMIPENLDSVANMSRFVARKQAT
jgi:acyl carrier protein